jgi:hypothetical protein
MAPAGLPPYLTWAITDPRAGVPSIAQSGGLGAWPSGRGENALVRVVVTRIEQDGTMQRRVVDTAQCDDCLQWERLAARALEFPPPYRPVPGMPVYHVSVDDQVILVAEHDLGGPLLNLVTAVLTLGEEVLVRSLSSGSSETAVDTAALPLSGGPHARAASAPDPCQNAPDRGGNPGYSGERKLASTCIA